MDEHRVAEVFASRAEQKRYGSGYLIAPGLLLSAHHVVAPALEEGGRCEVRLLGDCVQGRHTWGDYQVCWADAALDLALLRPLPGTAAYAAGDAAPARLTRLQRSAAHSPECVALGFPRVQRHDKRNGTLQVSGRIRSLSLLQEDLLQITVEGAAPKDDEDWKGVSGAALFCGAQLVGVITQTETCFRDGVLIAQPIAAVFTQAGFLQALGALGQAGFETLGAGHDPRPWQALYGLTYLVDRQVPVGELEAAVGALQQPPSGPRVLVCAVPGEPEHEHGDLIELFRKETLPALFPGKPGFDSLEHIDWPDTADSVAQGLGALRIRLHKVLGVPAEADAQRRAQQVAGAFNDNVTPRSFYCEIRASQFTALQRDLARAWLAEWGQVAAAGLNDLVALFICLVFDPLPPPAPRPWWKKLLGADPLALVSLQAFAQQQFGPLDQVQDQGRLRLLRLSRLAPCERRAHLTEWRLKLEAQPPHRWLAGHVTTVHMKVNQDPFALRTLLETLTALENPPPLPPLRS